jgi:hypothetical protein
MGHASLLISRVHSEIDWMHKCFNLGETLHSELRICL